MDQKAEKPQHTLVDKDGTIQAIILIRGSEFYCFERLEDSPKSFKEAQELYADCSIVDLHLSTKLAKS